MKRLLFVMAFMSCLTTRALAYDFEAGNLLYSIVSSNPPEVCLEGSVDGEEFQGDLNIPATVIYDGVEYAVTTVASYAFWHCGQLTGLYVPASLTNIGDGINPFLGTTLDTIVVDDNNPVYHAQGKCIVDERTATLAVGCNNSVIPDDVVIIGKWAFGECLSHMPSIPANVKTIGYGAFFGCLDTSSLVLPNSVEVIGDYAFSHCCFKKIVIPNSIDTIWFEAFGYNPYLRELVLSETVSYIVMNAFCYTDNLDKIYSFNPIPPLIDLGAFPDFSNFINLTIYVPQGSVEAYQNARGWRDCTNIQPLPCWEEWYYEIVNENGSITYQHLEYLADTTIGNERPKIIVRTNQIYDKKSQKEVTHEYIYERDNKVYWWNKELLLFTILYDFAAQAGDSWEIKVGTQSLTMHVDEVEIFEYEGKYYRMLQVSDVDGLFSGSIVCGVGHLTSFFPERLMSHGKDYRVEGIRCYWQEGNLVFKYGEMDCDEIYEQYHHGVDESLSESGLVVYPNPTNGILFVEHGQGEYQIVNLMGQTVMSGTLNGQPIDISRLSNGFYLLKCNYLSIKFVVNQ